jgi:hypothetical protein
VCLCVPSALYITTGTAPAQDYAALKASLMKIAQAQPAQASKDSNSIDCIAPAKILQSDPNSIDCNVALPSHQHRHQQACSRPQCLPSARSAMPSHQQRRSSTRSLHAQDKANSPIASYDASEVWVFQREPRLNTKNEIPRPRRLSAASPKSRVRAHSREVALLTR